MRKCGNGSACPPVSAQTLKQFLGINPMGVAATIEEIAQREGKQMGHIRSKII